MRQFTGLVLHKREIFIICEMYYIYCICKMLANKAFFREKINIIITMNSDMATIICTMKRLTAVSQEQR